MKFNSQICTTREQSERLLSLGLKKETADMKWLGCSDENGDIYHLLSDVPHHFRSTDIPAWSLHRMMSMLTAKRKCLLIRVEADLYDVLINRIEHEIKEGYFNKEYLVNQAEIEGHCKGVLEYLDYIREEE